MIIEEIVFEDAVRKQVKLKLGITGPSGSGKTRSALEIASGIGGKIALVDTENGSASLYSDRFKFKQITMKPPYLTSKYNASIAAAVKQGFDILIIDQISHAWSGEGGILGRKTQRDLRGGNPYTNWADFTVEQELFISKVLNADIHLICTMRSKTGYELQDYQGKKVPVKMGLAPIQRDGVEYEFTCVFDIDMKHQAMASKDRTGLFDGEIFTATKETGETLLKWLNTEGAHDHQKTNEVANEKGKAKNGEVRKNTKDNQVVQE